jgi:UDP-N-acetylmuramoyl-L-alanyl-D-glutamate--2,6-diaminopimelate ligase
MNWKEIAEEVTAVGAGGDSKQPVTGVEYDSRKVRQGSVFVAMKGGSTDGNRYVEKAIAAGALGIITDSSQKFDHLLVFKAGLPVLEVEHGRRALAQASAAFFGHPERKLAATGITGTNGKTTTAFLLEALLNAAERKTVLVGTIEYHVAGEVRPSVHTTPESRDLYELMAEGAGRGATELVSLRFQATRSTRGALPEWFSTWLSSPISPKTTWIITRPWRSTSRPSGCCSTGRFIRRRAWL